MFVKTIRNTKKGSSVHVYECDHYSLDCEDGDGDGVVLCMEGDNIGQISLMFSDTENSETIRVFTMNSRGQTIDSYYFGA